MGRVRFARPIEAQPSYFEKISRAQSPNRWIHPLCQDMYLFETPDVDVEGSLIPDGKEANNVGGEMRTAELTRDRTSQVINQKGAHLFSGKYWFCIGRL